MCELAHVRNNLLYLAFSLLLCSAVSAQEGANNLTQLHELSKQCESPSASLGASAKRAICSPG